MRQSPAKASTPLGIFTCGQYSEKFLTAKTRRSQRRRTNLCGRLPASEGCALAVTGDCHRAFEALTWRAVSYAGSDWLTRFYNLRNNGAVSIRYQVERLGPVKPGDDPYERNQRWALYRGMGYGTDKLRLIALWNGKKDEHRPGRDDQPAVAHIVQEARQAGVTVEHLNTTKFEHWNAAA